MTTPNGQPPESDSASPGDGTISGRSVVISMFVLAFVLIGALYTYWNLHLMPFMPLQEAIAAEFEESSPRVDGGRRKMHKGTPNILRVVMRVPFDPNADDNKTKTLIEKRVDGTLELARQNVDEFSDYNVLEVHMYQEEKEGELSQNSFERELKPVVEE